MLVNNKVLDEDKVRAIINDVREKKELKELSEEFIREHLLKYLQQERKTTTLLIDNFNQKSSNYKRLIKKLRAKLRRLYGLFRVEEGLKKRKGLFDGLLKIKKEKDRKNAAVEILKTHSSTKERLPFYSQLYKKIFSITGKPEIIIDLGCGINPFSIHYMGLMGPKKTNKTNKTKKLNEPNESNKSNKSKKSEGLNGLNGLNYYAYDLSMEEIDSLNRYFSLLHEENKKFKGRAEILDISHWAKLGKLGKADICFLFKMSDVLDRSSGHKATETVVKNVPARFVVVSFPTKTMSGKKMNFPRRRWIELMCKRLGYGFKIIKFANEIFYVVKK